MHSPPREKFLYPRAFEANFYISAMDHNRIIVRVPLYFEKALISQN